MDKVDRFTRPGERNLPHEVLVLGGPYRIGFQPAQHLGEHRRRLGGDLGVPSPAVWDPLRRVFDAFGFDRCMWGTDWTRAVNVLTYKQGVDAFHRKFESISLQRRVGRSSD